MPGIYDNISTRLLPALKQTLADSERADFSVGYFNLRGWKLIDDLVEQLDGSEASRVRLLVGMQRPPEEELRSAMSLLPDGDEISLQKALRLRRQVADEFRQQLVMGAPSNSDEAALRRLRIARLRLFLKLMAQVEKESEIEPLPDLDFNLRAGNTLVGFTTLDEVQKALTSKLDFENSQETIKAKASEADDAFQIFRWMQVEERVDSEELRQAKADVREKLRELNDELDRYLALEYAVPASDVQAFEAWRESHQPFHWLAEFYGIVHSGGFNAIVGNPPWVEYRNVSGQYQIKGFASRTCNNLWAFVTERSLSILKRSGRCGLIVPMSLVSTQRMKPIQEQIRAAGTSWASSYESDSNPGQLFEGVKQNVSILLCLSTDVQKRWTTRLMRFFSEARNVVFPSVQYEYSDSNYIGFGFPKVSTSIETDILDKMFQHSALRAQLAGNDGIPIYVHRIAHYYIKCFDFIPYFRSDRDGVKKSEDYKEYTFSPPVQPLSAIINSSAFYFYWQVFFDAFKAGKHTVESFPCNAVQDDKLTDELTKLAELLMSDMQTNSNRLHARYAASGDVEYDQFYPRLSKQIIDEIDRVLAEHYGFTDEELDFIINYDIKYRVGSELS